MELVMSQFFAKCNYSDTFGMVKYWETIIYNFLDQGIQTLFKDSRRVTIRTGIAYVKGYCWWSQLVIH